MKDQPRRGYDAVRNEFVSPPSEGSEFAGGNCRSAGRVAMQVNKAARGASAEGFSERPAESAPTACAAIPASDVSVDTAVATAAPPTILVASADRFAMDSAQRRLRFRFQSPRSVEFCARWSYRGTVEVVLDDMLKVKDVKSAKSLRNHMLEAKKKSAEPEE